MKEISDIFETLLNLCENKTLTILSDCCYSGMWTQDEIINQLSIHKSISIIAACEGNKPAYDREFAKIFTK